MAELGWQMWVHGYLWYEFRRGVWSVELGGGRRRIRWRRIETKKK